LEGKSKEMINERKKERKEGRGDEWRKQEKRSSGGKFA
jgi:hypothetical protein